MAHVEQDFVITRAVPVAAILVHKCLFEPGFVSHTSTTLTFILNLSLPHM